MPWLESNQRESVQSRVAGTSGQGEAILSLESSPDGADLGGREARVVGDVLDVVEASPSGLDRGHELGRDVGFALGPALSRGGAAGHWSSALTSNLFSHAASCPPPASMMQAWTSAIARWVARWCP